MKNQKMNDRDVATLLRTINHLCLIAANHISSDADYDCQLAIQQLVESEYLEHIINQYEPDFPVGHPTPGLTDEGVDVISDTEVCQALSEYYNGNTDPIDRPAPRRNNGRS